MKTSKVYIGYRDALAVKCAETWLKLGQPIKAWMELQQVSEKSRTDPTVREMFAAAMKAMRGFGANPAAA